MKAKEYVTDFTKIRSLFLETADYRLFVQPYGPEYPDAVGKVYQLTSGSGRGHGEIPLGYVKKIEPKLPSGEDVPIEINSQKINKKREVVTLNGEVRYGSHWTNYRTGLIPDGTKIELELYLDSCQTYEIPKPPLPST